MKSLFDESESREFVGKYSAFPEEMALRVYTSRLIGREANLVLHGGGNTSVKLPMKNIVGEEQEVLYVKASGIDLATIEPAGFVGLDLDPIRKLQILESLSDEETENQMQIHKVVAASPAPSVEAFLHAFLPPKYVDHTHADSILVLTNQKNGEDVVKDALGLGVAVLPYTMSGLPLAKGVLELYKKHHNLEAIVMLNHGIFTFGGDARTSYDRMIEYVSRAEAYIDKMTQRKAIGTLPHRI